MTSLGCGFRGSRDLLHGNVNTLHGNVNTKVYGELINFAASYFPLHSYALVCPSWH